MRQGLEPALTQQSWLRALCFTALPAYFRSRPRTLAVKTRPGGLPEDTGGGGDDEEEDEMADLLEERKRISR